MVDVLYYKGSPLNVTLPNFIESEVTYCEPGVRKHNSRATKPAPSLQGDGQRTLFIDQGEILKIDTRTRST